MPGLVPGIHVLLLPKRCKKDMDGRDKPGHDGIQIGDFSVSRACMQPNILFIMADQLRWDYLGCTGHPHIKTPVIDALAARGVNFTRAFVQAPVCGGSRMSFYTGRYNVDPRRDLQQFSAAHRREDDRRLSAPARLPRRARRQDPHGGGSRGDGAARHRSGLERRRARGAVRLRALRARRRPASRTSRPIRTLPTIRGCASSATAATIPGTISPIRSRATTARCCPAGRCATRAGRRA